MLFAFWTLLLCLDAPADLAAGMVGPDDPSLLVVPGLAPAAFTVSKSLIWAVLGAMSCLLALMFALAKILLCRRRSARSLMRSEMRFRKLVESSQQGILVHRDWMPLFANRALASMAGFEGPEELLQLDSVARLVAPEERERLGTYLQAWMRGEAAQRGYEFRSLRRDGSRGWWESSSVPIDWEGQAAMLTTLVDITERKTAEAALEEQSRLLQAILNAIPAPVFYKDREGIYLGCNSAFERFIGLPRKKIVGKGVYDVAPKDLAEIYFRADAELIGRGGTQVYETRVSGADGVRRDVMFHKAVFPRGDGGPGGMVGAMLDISERKRAEQTVAQKHAFLQKVIDGVVDPILVVDLDRRVRMMNRAARGNQDDPRPVEGEPFCHEVSARQDLPCGGPEGSCTLEEVRRTGKPVALIHEHTLRDGRRRIFELQVSPLRGEDGSLEGIIEVARDITDRQQMKAKLRENEDRLQYLAYHDSLTNLPNRVLLHDRLHHAMAGVRGSGRKVAVLYLDLDRFKKINDSLGHAVGDRVLSEVARRLRGCTRDVDTVARLGGDEFVVILEQIEDIKQIVQVAGKIHRVLLQPILAEGQELYVTSSIGISLFPDNGEDVEGLLRFADAAMYRAKEKGRNTYQFYTPDMNARAHELLVLESSLRKALDQEQLVLHYQPQFDMASGRLLGMEALVRWEHPQRGTVSPGDFIPLAEETGLVVPIGEWVLRHACAQTKAWLDKGHPPVRLAVNISARQFRQLDLVETVSRILEETGLEPRLLELEITESLIMDDVEAAISTMNELHRRGVQLAIDDFGSGYSSLSYLKRFPVTKLKIDRSFVRDVTSGPKDAAMVASVIALARNMNLEVVAEGVEAESQVRFLLEKGCTQGQGFLFARPMPAKKFERLFERRAHRVHSIEVGARYGGQAV